MNMPVAVDVRDLTVAYGTLKVLKDLQLTVEKGEFLVLLGSSGCGKSTLLNVIAGLADIAEGEIHISGRNVTWADPSQRGIGMVFQSYALYPRMTVRQNLAFALEAARLPRAEIAARVAEAARILQIEPLLDRRPAALSGGQRQRVAIGRALVRHVDVFLFDEPLSNLDAKLRTELRLELKHLHQSLGNTMIYVTHDQVEALTLADRVAVMRSGRIEQLDTPEAIYHRPANLYVAGFVGSPQMSFVPGLLRLDAEGPRFEAPGLSVALAGYPFLAPPVEGDVVLGLRAENVALMPDAAAAAYRGRVVLVEPTGADTMAWLDVEGARVTIRCPNRSPIRQGDLLGFALAPGALSLFSASTEVLL